MVRYIGEWRPGVLERVLVGVAADGNVRMGAALAELAQVAETRTKQALTIRSHPYRTVTPASPGGPPALVSGTLRRSVTHTRVSVEVTGWFTKVGTGAGFYPPYGGRRRTSSSKYGFYLETGLRNGATYPFLVPNVRDAVLFAGPVIWRAHMRGLG